MKNLRKKLLFFVFAVLCSTPIVEADLGSSFSWSSYLTRSISQSWNYMAQPASQGISNIMSYITPTTDALGRNLFLGSILAMLYLRKIPNNETRIESHISSSQSNYTQKPLITESSGVGELTRLDGLNDNEPQALVASNQENSLLEYKQSIPEWRAGDRLMAGVIEILNLPMFMRRPFMLFTEQEERECLDLYHRHHFATNNWELYKKKIIRDNGEFKPLSENEEKELSELNAQNVLSQNDIAKRNKLNNRKILEVNIKSGEIEPLSQSEMERYNYLFELLKAGGKTWLVGNLEIDGPLTGHEYQVFNNFSRGTIEEILELENGKA